MKNKSIKELENELKNKTGAGKLPEGKTNIKNSFDSSTFIKLAREVKKIFIEDEHNTSSAFKPV